MSQTVAGLTAVTTEDLKQLLQGLHRGLFDQPFDIHCVTACKLQHVAEPLLGQMRGLEPKGVRAVLVAVLAERLNG